jgi:hypothetical protein
VLTIFSVPKAFEGEIGQIQGNAVRSWSELPGEVVLVGDERGVAEVAAEVGAVHVGGVATTDHGTPRLDDAFARVERLARHPMRCFVNADIVLFEDAPAAAAATLEHARAFLLVGETIDLAVSSDVIAPAEREALRAQARDEGRTRGATAIDYFIFTPDLFGPIPPFAVGRARFDNWLVWRARQNAIVVDGTEAILAVHQRHDYGHLAGGQDAAHFGPEAERNLNLAGGKRRLYTINDASHRLTADGHLRRNLGAFGRLSENSRKIAWKLRHRR